jgi:hypothetical protein
MIASVIGASSSEVRVRNPAQPVNIDDHRPIRSLWRSLTARFASGFAALCWTTA